MVQYRYSSRWPVMWPGQFSVTPWFSLSSRQLLPRLSSLLQRFHCSDCITALTVGQFRGTSDHGRRGGADIYSSGPGPRSNCPPWHQADHQALFLVRTLAGPWLQYRTDWQAHLLCFHWTLHSYTNCFYFLILLKTAQVQSWTSLYFKESKVGSRILFKS